MPFVLWVQPEFGNPVADFQTGIANAATAKRVAKWLHDSTGAAVQIYDERKSRVVVTFGAFDEART